MEMKFPDHPAFYQALIQYSQEQLEKHLTPDITLDLAPVDNKASDIDVVEKKVVRDVDPDSMLQQQIENHEEEETQLQEKIDSELPKTDALGTPYDKRIHSAAQEPFMKSGARKGCWKYRKGVDPELIKRVEAELQGSPLPEMEVRDPLVPELSDHAKELKFLIDSVIESGKMSMVEIEQLYKPFQIESIDKIYAGNEQIIESCKTVLNNAVSVA